MLTEPGDLVVDPFAGSCVTGEVCERIDRRWLCIELMREYCEAALARFVRDPKETARPAGNPQASSNFYRVPGPGILWNGDAGPRLPQDGGRERRLKPQGGTTRQGPMGGEVPARLDDQETEVSAVTASVSPVEEQS